MKTFADRLREGIDQSGLSQVDFAAAARISTPALSNYLKGKRAPTADALLRIATALGVTASWLLSGEGEKKDWSQTVKEDAAFAEEMRDKADPEQVIFDLRVERRRTKRLEDENKALKEKLDSLEKSLFELAKSLKPETVETLPPKKTKP